MKLYRLESTVLARGDKFDLRDPKSRVSDFFVLNQGSEKPFQYSKPRAQAQSRIRLQDVLKSDYLSATMDVPIFSERARVVLSAALPDELRFYECAVECEGQELGFFLAQTQLHLPLIDMENSSCHTLTDGQKIPMKAAYFTSFEKEFAIARDVDFPSYMVVSQRFVDLCGRESLQIKFAEPL